MKSLKDLVQNQEIDKKKPEQNYALLTNENPKSQECLNFPSQQIKKEVNSIDSISLNAYLLEIVKELKISLDVVNLRFLRLDELQKTADSWERILLLQHPNLTVSELKQAYEIGLLNFNPPSDSEKRFGITEIKTILFKIKEKQDRDREMEELRIYNENLNSTYKTKCDNCFDNGWIFLDEDYLFKNKKIVVASTKPCQCEIGQKYAAAYAYALDNPKPVGYKNATLKAKPQNLQENEFDNEEDEYPSSFEEDNFSENKSSLDFPDFDDDVF